MAKYDSDLVRSFKQPHDSSDRKEETPEPCEQKKQPEHIEVRARIDAKGRISVKLIIAVIVIVASTSVLVWEICFR